MVPESVINKQTGDKILNLIKRAGSNILVAGDGQVARGAFLWKDQQKLYVAVGTNVRVYNSDTGALLATLAGVFPSSVGYVGFDEFLYDSGVTKLVVTDGTKLSTIDSSNVVVASADADLPVHAPYPVVVDGYLFLLKLNTSDLYNSDQDDPLAWTSGDFITAEMRADQAVRPARLNNYIVVFGTKSIEYFYDAANTSGSPLSRNDSPVKSVGYVGGFAQFGNQIYFVGEMSESGVEVFMLEDFKITPMGNEAIRRHLSMYANSPIIGAIVSFGGHDLYIFNTGSSSYALEIETKLWGPWSYGQLAYFPITWSLQNYGISGYRNLFLLNDTTVYSFNTSVGSDNFAAFPSIIVTKNEEFDSYNQKFGHRLCIWGDQQAASQPVLVQWTDDDYKTFSVAQTVEMTSELPCIRRLGRFRRRAHKITYIGTDLWRVTSIEIDLNFGDT